MGMLGGGGGGMGGRGGGEPTTGLGDGCELDRVEELESPTKKVMEVTAKVMTSTSAYI